VSPLRLTWPQVLAWRFERHHLAECDGGDAVSVADRLCGVQAQVLSAAELSVAVRQAAPTPGQLAAAVADGRLLRMWAARGTLHVLSPRMAAATLALVQAGLERAVPARTPPLFTAAQLDVLADVVGTLLADGRPRTREELIVAVAATGDDYLTEQMRSSWGRALKRLSWRGLLCHGPGEGTRVTFTRPDRVAVDWLGLLDVESAARSLIPAYLAVHGPASPAAFNQWLLSGNVIRRVLAGWLDAVRDELQTVEVEGLPLLARVADADSLAAARPVDRLRLLPAFDQYVLGPGTADPHVVPPPFRKRVARAAGWISPVVVHGGRIVGTWREDVGAVRVEFFAPGDPPVHPDAVKAEVARIATAAGRPLSSSTP
jgi:hypothetical protein